MELPYSRIDWVTLQRTDEVDNMHYWQEQYRKNLDPLRASGVQGDYKFRIVSGTIKEKRKWCVDVWGELAHAWFLVEDAAFFQDHATRMDFRRPMVASEQGIKDLGRLTQDNVKDARNVTIYQSRKRNKQAKRSAGGKGYAVGSHKSNKRNSFYRRGDERPCVEVQVGGSELAKAWDIYDRQTDAGMPQDEAIKVACSVMTTQCMADLAGDAGMSLAEFMRVAEQGVAQDEPDLLELVSRVHDALQGPLGRAENKLLTAVEEYLSEVGFAASE